MNTFSVGLQPKLIRGPPLRSTQKATLMTEDGECVAVDVPRLTSTTVEADLYLPLFKDHIDSSKRGGHNSPLNLVSMVVPFTTLLAAEQSAVLIYHKLNESDIDSESGRFPGLDENGTAMRLTAALETGAQITIYGSAVVFYLQPGKDFHPEPDLQSLHDIIAQDLYIAIKNNLTGGELGSSPDLNRRRLEMVAKMYGTEYRAKSKRPRKNSWKFESMFSGTPFVAATKVKYVTDDRGVTAADRMRQAMIDLFDETKGPPTMKKIEAYKAARRAADDEHFGSSRRCGFCDRNAPEAKACSGCKSVFYCDSTCQRSHWKQHKSTCKKATSRQKMNQRDRLK